jgi:hypothetical protein
MAGLLAAAAALAGACETFTDVIGPTHYSAALNGANVKPSAVVTSGTGTMTASWNPTTGLLTYTLGWTDVSGAAVSAHLHGPADANGVAEVLIDFAAPPAGHTGPPIVLTTQGAPGTGSASGSIDLSQPITPTVSGDSLVILLQRGRLYVDVHTGTAATVHIRGNLREN